MIGFKSILPNGTVSSVFVRGVFFKLYFFLHFFKHELLLQVLNSFVNHEFLNDVPSENISLKNLLLFLKDVRLSMYHKNVLYHDVCQMWRDRMIVNSLLDCFEGDSCSFNTFELPFDVMLSNVIAECYREFSQWEAYVVFMFHTLGWSIMYCKMNGEEVVKRFNDNTMTNLLKTLAINCIEDLSLELNSIQTINISNV